MPHNGEQNEKFGFFQNLCCGEEIAVPAGSQFPDCSNHRGLTTVWKPKPVVDDSVQLGNTNSHEPHVPIFNLDDEVLFVGLGEQRGKPGVVEVTEGSLGQVDRYQVRLNDGTWIRCFGFELELTSRGASSENA
jgi:hypothetical protein